MNEWIHFISLSLHETPLYRGRNRLREVMWHVQGTQLKNDPVQLWRWVFWLQEDTPFPPINMLRTARATSHLRYSQSLFPCLSTLSPLHCMLPAVSWSYGPISHLQAFTHAGSWPGAPSLFPVSWLPMPTHPVNLSIKALSSRKSALICLLG